ncbi:mechanosensitive ion channel family protein [Maribellus sp. CM-23]|uniref:mechanosensitive ion channel family protein n=1 Tax=Maribellus sp. CM-23 TaxID=2781026 RepID=UPI001F2BA0CC|nr:mechanosensitive ion channel family protein [Maribellus sp. CM-23]MCE4564860.1 mechanosensitive ion channel family protein [Maribellus sp. CM-23]
MLQKIHLIFLALFFSLQLTAQDNPSSTQKINVAVSQKDYGYVIFNDDTLFVLKANLGPTSPIERAALINKRLKQLHKENLALTDSFQAIDVGLYAMLTYKDTPILSISDEDAALAHQTRHELIRVYQQALQSAFKEDLRSRSAWYWITHVLYTLLTFLGLYVILYLVNRLFKWIDNKVLHYQKLINARVTSYLRYLTPRGPEYFVSFLLKILKVAIWGLILFLYLPLLFGFLPWTKGLVSDFYAFISIPIKQIFNSLWLFISEKLIYIILIFFVSKYLLRVVSFVSSELSSGKLKIKGFHEDWAKPTYNIVRVLVLAFTLVFMWPYIPGSQSEAFKGVSIFLGILFSLGSTSAIANIVAGIVITYMRPFQLGDRVKIGETIGDVVEKNLLVTRVKTLKNEDITIPNSTIINTHLWNYSKNASQMGIILHTTVTIGYDVPYRVVTELLLKAAKNTPNLTREFKPFVLQKNLNDFYIEYELNVYTKQPGKMMLFYSELHKSIVDEFNKAGVEIMSPHYSAFRNGNQSTVIPPDEPQVKKKTGSANTNKTQTKEK